jgi:hypothetical protein
MPESIPAPNSVSFEKSEIFFIEITSGSMKIMRMRQRLKQWFSTLIEPRTNKLIKTNNKNEISLSND